MTRPRASPARGRPRHRHDEPARAYVVLAVVLVAATAARVGAGAAGARDYSTVMPFFDVRGRPAHVADGAEHNALARIDPSRVWSAIPHRTGAHSVVDADGGDVFVVRVDGGNVFHVDDVVRIDVSTTTTPNSTFATHWIAAYSPAGADVTATAPVKYAVLADVDGAYVEGGRASARFRLASHRAETYDFVLFASPMVRDDDGIDRPDIDHAVAIARSDAVTLEGAMEPMWPRVTLPPAWAGASARAGASVRITWQSGRNASHSPTLSYRVPDGELVRVRAMTTTYDAKDLCGGVAASFGYRHPGYVHTADVVAAAGDVVEYYLSDDVNVANVPRYEMTMPVAEGPDASMTIAMFADMGRGSDDDSFTWHSYGRPALNVSAALSADARDGKIHAAFLFGDLSYAVGFASVWDEWASQIQNWTSRVPFLTNMGNHELDTPPDAWTSAPNRVPDAFGGDDSGGECGVPATTLYPSPRQGIDADWFAVTLGSIRVVSIDTEVDFTSTSPQGRWLAGELASIDRTRTPWVVLGGHRPGVIDSTDGPDNREAPPAGKLNPSDLSVMALIQEHVWPLLVRYNVTLAFWGHNHVYQRSCAWSVIARGAADGCAAFSSTKAGDDVATYVEPGAPVNIVVGTGGARHTHNGHGHSFTEKSFYKFGYVRLTALNRTHMYGEFQEAGEGGQVLDKFLITQRDYGSASDDATAMLIAQLRAEAAEWKSLTYVMALFTCATLGVFAFLVYTRWRAAQSDVRHRFHILREMDDDAADIDGTVV